MNNRNEVWRVMSPLVLLTLWSHTSVISCYGWPKGNMLILCCPDHSCPYFVNRRISRDYRRGMHIFEWVRLLCSALKIPWGKVAPTSWYRHLQWDAPLWSHQHPCQPAFVWPRVLPCTNHAHITIHSTNTTLWQNGWLKVVGETHQLRHEIGPKLWCVTVPRSCSTRAVGLQKYREGLPAEQTALNWWELSCQRRSFKTNARQTLQKDIPSFWRRKVVGRDLLAQLAPLCAIILGLPVVAFSSLFSLSNCVCVCVFGFQTTIGTQLMSTTFSFRFISHQRISQGSGHHLALLRKTE